MKILLGYLEEAGAISTGASSGDDLMERLDAWTAGRLASLLREHSGVVDSDGAIPDAVAARNRIVHRYFMEHLPMIPMDANAFAAACDELDELISAVERAEALIWPKVARLGTSVDNIDFPALERALEDAFADGPHAQPARLSVTLDAEGLPVPCRVASDSDGGVTRSASVARRG